MTKRIDIDADLSDADWIKQRWPRDLPRSKSGLLAALKRMGMTVAHFKRLPLYKRNVGSLKFLREL